MDFYGMISISDYIDMLRHCHDRRKSGEEINLVEQLKHSIVQWRAVLEKKQELVYISPEETLYDASRLLLKFNVHRIPIMDTESNLCMTMLTHTILLKCVIVGVKERTVFRSTVEELGLGEYEKVVAISRKTPFIEALHIFVKKKISALPLLDNQGTKNIQTFLLLHITSVLTKFAGKLVAVYPKFEVKEFVKKNIFNFDNFKIPVFDILRDTVRTSFFSLLSFLMETFPQKFDRKKKRILSLDKIRSCSFVKNQIR